MYKIRNEMNRVYLINEEKEMIGQVLFPDIGENRVMIHKIMIDGNAKESELLDLLLKEAAKRLLRDGKKVYLVHPLAIEWFSEHEEYQALVWKQKKV